MTAELPLNWQNDPIYFDSEARPVNEWLNANELVTNNRINDIFLGDKKTLNLYPLMVRRSDFIREKPADRILARFPYMQLTEEEKEIITNQELLIAEKLRDYFYKSDNRRILEWRDILQKDLERGFIPLPFLRCFPEELKIDFHDRSFESARGEAFTMPLQLTEEIAYLSGMVNGDGSLKKYVLLIVDYSIENIRQLKEQFQRLFDQTGRIQLQTENSPTLIITNLWVVRFFSFLTNQPIGGKKYHALREPLLFQQQPFRFQYWSGVMDADGSYINGNVKLVSASEIYIQDFCQFLKTMAIESKCVNRGDGTYQAYISRKFHHIYKEHLNCNHPGKKLDFLKLKQGREKSKTNAKYFRAFNESKIVNDYFNFENINGLQVFGAGKKIKSLRGDLLQKDFSKSIGITASMISQIERNKTAASINVIQKILQQTTNVDLMSWLFSLGRTIQFRRGNAKPVYLELKPSLDLEYIVKKLVFYPTSIRLVSDDNNNFIEKVENKFGIKIKNNLITNGVLRYYFSTFCILEEKK